MEEKPAVTPTPVPEQIQQDMDNNSNN